MKGGIVPMLSAVLIAGVASAGEGQPAKPRTVLAWFPHDLNNWDVKTLDWSAITHVGVRAVVAQADGTVKPGFGTTSENVKAVTEEAHKQGVKALIVLWGPKSAAESSQYLAQAPEKMAHTLLEFVKAHNLDGVELDDETWSKENAVTKGPNRDVVTSFCKVLRKTFKEARADYYIAYASPPVISAKDKHGASWMDYKAIAEEVDAFMVMSYCMFPPTIGWTGSNQAIEGGLGEHPRDFTTCVQDYLEATGGRKEKLLLGLETDLRGVEWKVRSPDPFADIYPLIEKPKPQTAQEARTNAEKHGRKFEPKQKAPWYCYKEGEHWVQGWYQDEESHTAVIELARKFDLAGIGLWGRDAVAPETFKRIKKHLHGLEVSSK